MLNLLWLLALIFTFAIQMVIGTYARICLEYEDQHVNCPNMAQFAFMFPRGTNHTDMYICNKPMARPYCDLCIPASTLCVIAVVACICTYLSVVNHLMCLAANFAHHYNPLCS